jgi:hypothetical protein
VTQLDKIVVGTLHESAGHQRSNERKADQSDLAESTQFGYTTAIIYRIENAKLVRFALPVNDGFNPKK